MRENKPERMALLMGSSWTQQPGSHACSEACAENLIPSGTGPRQKKTLVQKKEPGNFSYFRVNGVSQVNGGASSKNAFGSLDPLSRARGPEAIRILMLYGIRIRRLENLGISLTNCKSLKTPVLI